jgi:hypothetical protein
MRPLTARLRLTLDVFAGLALIAGALLFFGANSTDAWWSWTIEPPLTAATLGAFYWAAFVLILSAARSRTWDAARPAVYPVAVIALLLLLITVIHLDRFDTDSLFGVFWVAAYILVPLLLAWALAEQLGGWGEEIRGEETRGEKRRRVSRLPGGLRRALVVEGAALLALGLLLLTAPGAADDVWPWALSPLTSRAIGSFLFGIGLAALIAVRDDDPVSFRGAASAYTALGVLQLLALNLHIPDLGDRPLATVIYAAFWVAVVVTGAYGLRAARASSRS